MAAAITKDFHFFLSENEQKLSILALINPYQLVFEAVLLSTPVSFISMKESQGVKTASLLMKYKTNVDGSQSAKLFAPKPGFGP